ncbi:MAG TPA: response regulator [Phototrophicaceae bacterium]|nr:response regulator [Phototrophicaceae bacterium]
MDKHQILIVEDDNDLSEMLSAYFRVQNYNVLTAAWGGEAIRLVQDSPVDLVVLDIRLPDIDGFEVCRQMRTQRRTQDIPIIFLTEKRDRVDKLQGLELGVVDYITKPFDIQELRLRVRNAISRANRQSLANPVTDLPEGPMIDEKLNGLLFTEEKWAVLLLSISSLSQFRELYGFVAADDVLRAVALMVRNAVREFGSETDFIGHFEGEDFLIITGADHVQRIRERLEARISQSREYFYPLRDRDKAKKAMEENQLRLASGIVDHTAGPFTSLDALKTALTEKLKADQSSSSSNNSSS